MIGYFLSLSLRPRGLALLSTEQVWQLKQLGPVAKRCLLPQTAALAAAVAAAAAAAGWGHPHLYTKGQVLELRRDVPFDMFIGNRM